MTHSTAISHHAASDPPDLGAGWEYAGDVAVDSGSVLLIDPCCSRPSAEAVQLSLRNKGWSQVLLPGHVLPAAVACKSGIGDGLYPVFVRLVPSPIGAGQRVAELKVVFLEEPAA